MAHLSVAITWRRGLASVLEITKVPGNGKVAGLEKPIAGCGQLWPRPLGAGIRKKNSTFRNRYTRLKPRRGSQRAATAVGHAQLIALYWTLRNGLPYQDQPQEMDKQQRDTMIRHHLKRLTELGYKPA